MPQTVEQSAAASTNSSAGQVNAPGEKTYEAKGVVKEVNTAQKEITIKHEEIPGYMAAMTMPFEVRDTNLLSGLSPGDEVRFRLQITPKDGWIDQIAKTGQQQAEPERPPVRLVRDVDPLEIGSVMPNYTFTNSLGKKVSFSDFKGQALAMTFIFTRCPFPTFCPRMTSNFEEAFKKLQSTPDAPQNWHLFSISFDPTYDTPARLQAYAAPHHPDPAKWDFVTGALVDIDAITEQFGLAIAYKNGQFEHKLRTVVVDAAGKVRQIFIGNEWKPEDLVEEIVQGAKAK